MTGPSRVATGSTGRVDDGLWSAVGDPTRRRLVDLLLADGRSTATALSSRLPVSRQAVAKHLDVLDRAGLVHSSAQGRERFYEVDEQQLARAVAQLARVGSVWDTRLRRIAAIAEAVQRGQHAQTEPGSGRTHQRTGERRG